MSLNQRGYYLEQSMTKPEVPNTRPWSTTPMLNGSNLKMTNTGSKNGFTKSSTNNNIPNGTIPNGTLPNGIVTNGTSRSRPEVKNHSSVNNNLGNSFADFDKADIFSNTSVSSTGSSQGSQQNGFADFEHNTVYNASSNATTNGMPTPSALNAWAAQPTPLNPQNGVFNGVGATPLANSSASFHADDKYAALKDLDNEMKQQQHQDVWSTSNTGSTGSLYSSSTPTTGSVYGSPSPQGSIFGSPSQGQFMSAFAPLQDNNAQNANPFGTNSVSNPWATSNGFSSATNGFSNGTSNGFANSTANGLNIGVNGGINNTNGSNGVHTQTQSGFVNPFRDQGRVNGFTNVLPPMVQSNGINGMSNGWGGNPFKAGGITTMNSNNPFL